MISLRHPATGHVVKTNSESSDFWLAAGYREEKKAPAKRSASPKKSSK